MAKAPALLSLCTQAIAAALTDGSCDYVEELVELLPSDLLDGLVSVLPPLALESLHEASCGGFVGGLGNSRGRKRGRCEIFNTAWGVLFKTRWPGVVRQIKHLTSDDSTGKINFADCTTDWQQQYWEKHLQECLDEAAETALLPSFYGHIDELKISERIMNIICHSEVSEECSRLSYHCNRFGCYARCLRLQNVLCTRELDELLRPKELAKLTFIRIISKSQVDGACMLLNRHARTLLSLEFVHCQLFPSAMDQICDSICPRGLPNHGIQKFIIKSSRISESKSSTVSAGLLYFLSSGKSLHLLSLHDTKMQPSFAKMVTDTLLQSSCGLRTLDISENNIAGWLSKIERNSTNISSTLESNMSLNSLTTLNLRGNNLQKGDADGLCYILVKMPNLKSLDISDNPFTDEGVRLLIPFFVRALQKENPLSELRLENCELSSIGVIKLLECLTEPLDMLSVADNHLGSPVAAALAKFLGTSHLRELNVEDIELGAVGFQILEEELPREIALCRINISKNRGGIRTAYFLSKLILQAPCLVSVNAGANLLPPESLDVICNALKQTQCNLEKLDLTGNTQLSAANCPELLEFKNHGKNVVVIPSRQVVSTPYDDDP